jgi:predicted  nucleic acid-binding Zn-ribbon protein
MTINELLRQLHRLHLKIRDLREEKERAPRRLLAAKAKVEAAQKALAEHLDSIKHLKVGIHQNEVAIKEHQANIERFQGHMKAVTNMREYEALRSEIEHQRAAISKIEDAILEQMLELDRKNADTAELEKNLHHAQADYARCEKEISERQAGLLAQLAETEQTLQETEKHLDPELRAIYVRLVKAHGGADALCEMNDGSCSGCYMEMSPQQRLDLGANRIVVCHYCGRLLYA